MSEIYVTLQKFLKEKKAKGTSGTGIDFALRVLRIDIFMDSAIHLDIGPLAHNLT